MTPPDSARLAEIEAWLKADNAYLDEHNAGSTFNLAQDHTLTHPVHALAAIAIARRAMDRAERAEAEVESGWVLLAEMQKERDAARAAWHYHDHRRVEEVKRANKAETSLARLREAGKQIVNDYHASDAIFEQAVEALEAALAGADGGGVEKGASAPPRKTGLSGSPDLPTPAKPAEAAKCGALISGKEHRCGKPKGHAQDPNGGGCVCECELPKPPAPAPEPCPVTAIACEGAQVLTMPPNTQWVRISNAHCPACPSKGA